MRLTTALLVAAVAFALLAGPAHAEGASLRVTLELAAPGAPIAPLQETRAIAFTVHVSCALTLEKERLQMQVDHAPSWATVTVSPATFSPDPSTCAGGDWTGEGKVMIKTTEDAPALVADAVSLGANVASKTGSRSANATLPIEAGYFGIIDARIDEPTQGARPRARLEFPVVVTNFGNGDTALDFAIEGASAGWSFEAPAAIVLGSKQTGASQTHATVIVRGLTPAHVGAVNEVGGGSLLVTPRYALDEKLTGAPVRVSFIATSQGLYLPALGTLPTLTILAIGVALMRAKRA